MKIDKFGYFWFSQKEWEITKDKIRRFAMVEGKVFKSTKLFNEFTLWTYTKAKPPIPDIQFVGYGNFDHYEEVK